MALFTTSYYMAIPHPSLSGDLIATKIIDIHGHAVKALIGEYNGQKKQKLL